MATKVKGRGSNYGNYGSKYNDPGDNDRTALPGGTNKKPGIAVFNRRTLGGWWEVRAPNGKTAVVQQTDIGPSPRTGRVIDINSVAARNVFGLPYGNKFPTDQGKWSARYLGKKPPKGGGLAQKVKERAGKPPKLETTPDRAVAAGGLDTSALGQSPAALPTLGSVQPAMPPLTLPGSPAHSARRFLRSATGQTEVQTASWSPPEPERSSGISAQLQELQARTEATPFVGPPKETDLGTVDPKSNVPMPKASKGRREGATGEGSPKNLKKGRSPAAQGFKPKGLVKRSYVKSDSGNQIAAWIAAELDMARQLGWKGTVTSGYRSPADQRRVCAQTSGPCAAPGQSRHQGKNFPNGAVDVSDYNGLNRILRKMGSPLKWAGAKDLPHFSIPSGGSF